jgi:hypothetical protein
MKRAVLSLLIAITLLALAPRPAAAQDPSAQPIESRPSVFTYAGRGFLVGGMVGISAGYLVARSGGWNSDEDWQPLAYGTGIGALAGGALGLTLGIMDMNRNTPGYGAVILRDTVYGAGFGAVAGGIVGTLTFISTDEGEHVLLGASVGALVGAAAGVVLGVLEGNRALADNQRSASHMVTVAAATGADGHLVWMPTVLGRY